MASPEQSAIWGNFWQIFNLSKQLVTDYENLVSKPELRKELPQIDTAYIDSIIVHVSKIFTYSEGEPFRLEQFKTLCRPEIKSEIEQLQKEYKDIIGKIVINRNKLIAHLDKRFYDLCYSENAIEIMYSDMARNLNISLDEAKRDFATMPRTPDKSKERYSVSDFRDDLPNIRKMLNKLEDIWFRSMPFSEEKVEIAERNPSGFLSLSLRFALEYFDQLSKLREGGESKIQESNELTIHHRALWTSLIVEIRKLFGASFKEYKNYSLREIEFFQSEPHKTSIDRVFGDRLIQEIMKTGNTFTIHLGKHGGRPFTVKEICNPKLKELLGQLQTPIDAFAKHYETLNNSSRINK